MPNYSRNRTRLDDVLKTLIGTLSAINGVNVDRYIYTDIIKAFSVLSSMQPNSLVMVHGGTQYKDNEPFVKHNCSILLSGRNTGSMSDASNSNIEIMESIVDMIDKTILGKGNKKVYIAVESVVSIKFSENSLEGGYEIKFVIDDNGKELE